MIFPVIRLLALLLIVLSVIYIVVSFWSRNVRRRKLAAHWDKKGLTGDRDAFIRRGLEHYDRSFRRKLILLVYILPLAAIAAILIISNTA